MVILQKMTHEGFNSFKEMSIKNYAAQSVKAGRIKEEGSIEWSSNVLNKLLTDEDKTDGHYFFNVLNQETSIPIGYIWFYGIKAKMDKLFLYDIEIVKEHRGIGYGKATMAALEELGKTWGFNEIELHVYDWNKIALNLYKGMGFENKSYVMRKSF